MLLQKTREARPRIRSRGLSLEIRCKANLRPYKAMLYAQAHARQRVCKPRNSNASLYTPRLTSQIRELSYIAKDLTASADINPDSHAKSLEASIRTYVDLFYSINNKERTAYIDSFNNGSKPRIAPERNLLVLPALMAELRQPKADVARALFCSLYKMPFEVLRESSRSALNIVLLEQGMAIRSLQTEKVERFSRLISKVDSRINAIKAGTIRPQEDEAIKADFIERAIEFSRATEINVADLMEQMVGTDSVTRARMYRIMRRSRY